MSRLRDYQLKYPEFAIERDEGILHLRFHTQGAAFCWSAGAHRLLGDVLQDIDADPENRVLLLSGTGADFCGSIALPSFKGIGWDVITWEGKRYLSALLNLEIPVIATTAVGAAFDLIEDGVSGMIAAENDADSLAAKLDDVLRDADRRKEIGRLGRRRLLERCSYEENLAAFNAAVDYATRNR